MPTPDAALFAALSDPTRLQLLDRLRAEPGQSTSALTEGSGVTRQAVTKHLAVLAEAGLVRDVKQGRERVWEVDTTPLAAITAWVSGFTTTVATPQPEAEAQPEAAAPPAPDATPASEPVHASPGVAGTEASAFTAPRKPAARPGQVRRWRVPR